MKPAELLHPRPEGLYCPQGDFFIDPVRPVARALITHGHADHARAGHGTVLATRETLAIMAVRYGVNFAEATQTAEPDKSIRINEVDVSFHPAGHVLGSAQVAVANKGLRIVVSGDYKRARDPTCAPFEVVPCDVFVTEATFGLPIFRHPDAAEEMARLIESTRLFPERAHLVGAYSLGKAQRLVRLLRLAGYDRTIYLHGAMEKLMAFYQSEGIDLGSLAPARAADKPKLKGEIALCPPGQLTDVWTRGFPDPVAVFASGWMQTRARARQRGVELPLVVSDHADWPDLCRTILDTGCAEIWVTHGQEDALVHWAGTRGIAARPLNLVGYGDDDEATEAAP
ncbi:MAG: ligase-associated DNA damage response exonuclease [Beijerinckiaceae bacterium]